MMDNWRYVAEFSAEQDLHRILPVGTFKRFGRTVEITPKTVKQMVDNFNRQIPETGVPINAEHARSEGRLGSVTGLISRGDGVYASLDYTDTGRKMMDEERFQYVSPEIVWGPTDWEGFEGIENILVGLALTNSPFFGKDVSLFTTDDKGELREMITIVEWDKPYGGFQYYSDEVSPDAPIVKFVKYSDVKSGGTDDPPITLNEEELVEEQKFFEKFTQWLEERTKAPEPQEPAGPTPDEMALQKQVEELEAELSKQREEAELKARAEEFSALLPDIAPDTLSVDLAVFATVNPEAAKRLTDEYVALAAQVEEGKLFEEMGSASPIDENASGAEQFNTLVQEKVKEKGLSVGDAMAEVSRERPDLLKEARKAGRKN